MTDNELPERRPPPQNEDTARKTERKNAVTVYIDLLSEQWNINIADWLLDRLAILAERTPTTADENSALAYARIIFQHAEKNDRAYSKSERMLVRIGTLFSDIGKSGPVNGTPNQFELVTRMYAIENIPNPETLTVSDFFANYMRKPWFGEYYDRLFKWSWQMKLRKLFKTLGLGSANNLTMRQFYDVHTTWTLDLVSAEDSGLPKESIPAAACHHRLRGDNPRGILNDNDSYAVDYGANKSYNKVEKLVSALDLYDACIRRSGMTHDEAVFVLQATVTTGRNGFYSNDPEFAEIVHDIDEALKPQEDTE